LHEFNAQRWFVLTFVVCVSAWSFPAGAQTIDESSSPQLLAENEIALPEPVPPPAPGTATLIQPIRPLTIPSRQDPPSTLLNALQLSFVPLEAVDTYTTLRGVRDGLREANPVMRGTARHAVAMVAVKAAAATTTILLTRRLAKRNRMAAVVIMAALNGSYAMIVLHNVRQHRR
jgi:Domain of unknown function (DUF5658)